MTDNDIAAPQPPHGAPSTIHLAQGTLALPTQGEDHIAVMLRDWRRLRASIDGLKDQRREFASAGWAFVGVFAGALFAGIAWQPAAAGLTASQRQNAAWVWPTIIALGLASVVVAGVCFLAARFVGADTKKTVGHVLQEMDEMPRTPVA